MLKTLPLPYRHAFHITQLDAVEREDFGDLILIGDLIHAADLSEHRLGYLLLDSISNSGMLYLVEPDDVHEWIEYSEAIKHAKKDQAWRTYTK